MNNIDVNNQSIDFIKIHNRFDFRNKKLVELNNNIFQASMVVFNKLLLVKNIIELKLSHLIKKLSDHRLQVFTHLFHHITQPHIGSKTGEKRENISVHSGHEQTNKNHRLAGFALKELVDTEKNFLSGAKGLHKALSNLIMQSKTFKKNKTILQFRHHLNVFIPKIEVVLDRMNHILNNENDLGEKVQLISELYNGHLFVEYFELIEQLIIPYDQVLHLIKNNQQDLQSLLNEDPANYIMGPFAPSIFFQRVMRHKLPLEQINKGFDLESVINFLTEKLLELNSKIL